MVGAALGSTTAEPRLSRRQEEERQAAEAEQRWLDGLFYQSMIINHKVRMSACMPSSTTMATDRDQPSCYHVRPDPSSVR